MVAGFADEAENEEQSSKTMVEMLLSEGTRESCEGEKPRALCGSIFQDATKTKFGSNADIQLDLELVIISHRPGRNLVAHALGAELSNTHE